MKNTAPRACSFRKPVLRKRTTRVSLSAARQNDVFTNPTTESTTGKSAEGEQIRIEEETGLSSSTVEIDLKKQLEAQTLRIKELEKENQCVKNLLEDARAEVDSLTFSSTKLREDPDRFYFYTGLSPQAFDDVIYLVGPAADSMTYGTEKAAAESGKRQEKSQQRD